MTPNRYLMGIDGGGSKTLALLADETGRVLGRGEAGASNFQVIGHQAAQAAIQAAMDAAWRNASLAPQSLRGLCLGLAGVDRPGERALFQQWTAQIQPQAQSVIANDAELVLAASTPAGWGLALICGTGSIVYGRSPAGQVARADGWGHLLGDEGSGYAIGLAALRAVMRAYDGRGPATSLSEAILGCWGLAAATDLVPRVYQELRGKHEIAALASTVEAVAGQGDPVAPHPGQRRPGAGPGCTGCRTATGTGRPGSLWVGGWCHCGRSPGTGAVRDRGGPAGPDPLADNACSRTGPWGGQAGAGGFDRS